MIKFKSIKLVVDEAVATYKRFPLVILTALAALLLSFYQIRFKIADPQIVRDIFTLLLGIPLFLSLTLYFENRKPPIFSRLIFSFALGTLLLILYYFLSKNDATLNYAVRYTQISFALHLLTSFVLHISSTDENGFWEINKIYFTRALTSFLYSIVFFAGIAIALFTTEKLFNLQIDKDRYFELFLFSQLIITTWHFLSGIPKDFKVLENKTEYPKILKYFIQYLLIPLVSLYTLILYVYMLKILITNTWPEGYVGWLVSIMSILGVFNILLIYPEKNKQENRWLFSYIKYYFYLIIPLLILLFIAVGKRIAEYGITEKRCFLFVLGLWLLFISFGFIFNKIRNIKFIPISLFIVCVATIWGPLSPYSISLSNQMRRAEKILNQYQVIEKDILVRNTDLDKTMNNKEQRELYSIFEYVLRYHGTKSLQHWFPTTLLAEIIPNTTIIATQYSQPLALMKYLNLTNFSSNNERKYMEYQADNTKPTSLLSFNYLYRINLRPYKKSELKIKDQVFVFNLNEDTAIIDISEKDQIVSSIKLDELLKNLDEKSTINKDKIPQEDMKIEGTLNTIKYQIIIDYISANQRGKTKEVSNFTGLILFN